MMLQRRSSSLLPALRALPTLGAAHTSCRPSTSKRYKIRRVDYPWKMDLQREAWEYMRQDMVNYFRSQPQRDSTVNVRATPWPAFASKDEILEAGALPGLIARWGPQRRMVLNKEEMEKIAFDEPQGHLSHLFKGRLFRIHMDDWIEECVAVDASMHPVEQELYFVRFERHVPGKMTTVPIPVSLSGLWGCPGYHSGGHVDLSMPTIMVECVGEKIPPPFIIDVSKLQLEDPYSKITLRDIARMLPKDGTARFWRKYSLDEEVVMCYNPKVIGESPLPADYQDPNFEHRGGRYHLTYTGFWPRQTTRQ